MNRENYRYTVYDNKTESPIVVGKTSKECAKQMGIKFSSWYNCVNRCGNGSNKRWTILKHDRCEQIYMEDYPNAKNLPSMIRITQLAEFLSTTDKCVVDFCERIGCPIVRAGKQKIRMIPTKRFFRVWKEARYELG